jgi:hypothetical protein
MGDICVFEIVDLHLRIFEKEMKVRRGKARR